MSAQQSGPSARRAFIVARARALCEEKTVRSAARTIKRGACRRAGVPGRFPSHFCPYQRVSVSLPLGYFDGLSGQEFADANARRAPPRGRRRKNAGWGRRGHADGV
eukprot:11216374-Lingulodinium_polyedra.AAC.1